MTFKEIRAAFPHYTAVDDERQRLIYDLVLETQPLGHCMAEVGVYKGGTSYLIANTDNTRLLYACDSFKGLPEPTPNLDGHKKGDFSDVSYKEVKKLLSNYNVKVIKGFFPNDKLHKDVLNTLFSFVHIDVDLYQPTFDCLSAFYSRVVRGGVIVVDDYGMDTCPGVKRAVWEFMAAKAEQITDSGRKSCYWRKL